MLEELESLRVGALSEIRAAVDAAALEECRVRFLGRKGRLAAAGAAMRGIDASRRAAVGEKLNETRRAVTEAIEARASHLAAEADAKATAGVDVTLPGRPLPRGNSHPLTLICDRLVCSLRRMGFALAAGPEIETEYHCFDALNTPPDHPARNENDTFFFADGRLLRTHTSTVQIRAMETVRSLPMRIIAPGSAYRRDEIDATHLSQFTQIEGLYVNERVTLAELKGTLEFLFRSVFGESTQVRFRPHFFPFTEPSFEIDIKLQVAGRQDKWIEIAGCGMVDPNVFQSVCDKRGDRLFDPAAVTGFAFGMGVERLAMIMWGIPDIRLLIENDVRFLRQFA